MEQAEKLRQQKREEQERLKKDKQFSWNQKVGGWVGGWVATGGWVPLGLGGFGRREPGVTCQAHWVLLWA